MTTLRDAAGLARADQGLAVVSTVRADGSVQSTLVNAGVTTDPDTGGEVLAFVASGPVKLANLRARPAVTCTFRAGWRYGTVEGRARLIGPDDPAPGFDADRIRLLLREIFTAAGGTHDDWDAYDRAMVAERRVAVLVTPTRIYGS